MPKGGARIGAGRKTKTEEERVQALAINAIKKVWGSEDGAFEYLLTSKEPSLIKFALEHAFGKPKEKVDLSTPDHLKLKIIRGNKPSSE